MIKPKHEYDIPTVYVEGLKEDTYIKNFIHCYIPHRVPIGQRKLWGIEYPIKPINIKHEDSSELLLELATLSPDKNIGERIISRILFKSAFVMNVYTKMLSIEISTKTGVIPILQTRAFNLDLESAFTELYWLIEGYDGMILDREHKPRLDQNIFRPRPAGNLTPPPLNKHQAQRLHSRLQLQ